MNIELHCHSHYSKGTKLPTEGIPAPAEIIREAKRKGIGGIAITDHNVFRAFREARAEARKQGILYIPAIELHTLQGHLIGLGIQEAIPRDRDFEETVDLIHAQGGIAVAPHPYDIKGDGARDYFQKADAAEVFNSMNIDRFSNLVMRKKIGSFPAVAGSDAHTLDMIGNCVNTVEAHDLDSLLKEIRRGRVRHKTAYTPVRDLQAWSYLRLSGSREFVTGRIRTEYPPFKKWLSLRLLDKFLSNPGLFFTFLAHFGVACSFGYGGVKALHSI